MIMGVSRNSNTTIGLLTGSEFAKPMRTCTKPQLHRYYVLYGVVIATLDILIGYAMFVWTTTACSGSGLKRNGLQRRKMVMAREMNE